jgi:magnesium-transporting ATPase (P-type)
MNLFKKIGSNTGFLKVMGSIAVVQILLIYFGGAVFRTEGLNFKEWVVVILLSLIIIPFDLIRKLILKSVNKQNFKSV